MSPSASKLKRKAKALLKKSRVKQDMSEISAHGEKVKSTDSSAEAEDEQKVDPRPEESGSMWATSIPFVVSNGHFGRCR